MPKQSQSKQSKNYEALGKMLVNIYESGYTDRNQTYKASFVKGLFSGFGGVLGATILVAILLWILSLLHNVPLIGRAVTNIRNTVQTKETLK